MPTSEFKYYATSQLSYVYWLPQIRQEEELLVHEPSVSELIEDTDFL